MGRTFEWLRSANDGEQLAELLSRFYESVDREMIRMCTEHVVLSQYGEKPG